MTKFLENILRRTVLYDVFFVLFFRKGAAGTERREQEEHDAVRRSVSHQCPFLLHFHILKRYFLSCQTLTEKELWGD